MSTLTRDEAQTRARLLAVQHYAIDLDLTRGEELFGSSTVIRFTVLEPGEAGEGPGGAGAAVGTFVEVRPAVLHRATLDGQELDPAALEDGRLPLPALASGGHELRIDADMRYSHTGEGMHRFTDPADGNTYLYTQCCMTDAPLVFAAFDQPDLKAVFEVTVTAPPRWTVLGNGVAERVGDPGEGRWRTAPTPPISTYLVALAAGPWHSVRAEHAGRPFGLHVRRSMAAHLDADADELLAITRRCFDRYHEIFDEPYPFDSYDQAFVPEFNAGAMENPGLVTFRDEFVFRSAVTDTQRQTRAMVIAHEMAHMWFGDLVTLRWWDDIWLNESFAEYMGHQILTEATRFDGIWTDFGISRKAWGYDADQRPSTHPVAPDPEGVPDTATAQLNFDGISYAKGASALRQLVAWLGERTFLKGINDHFTRHRFGNATLADFIDSLARVSDRDVQAWARSWLRTSGVDTLTPTVEAEVGTGQWRLLLAHHGSRPHRITISSYDQAPADPARLVLRERGGAELPGVGGTTTLAFNGPPPDLLLLNDGDLTYAKIRLDQDSWRTVRQSLSGLPDPLSRAVVWNAARDMVRDAAGFSATDYLEAARIHLPRETDNAIVQGVLTAARTQIADRYLPAGQRTGALETLTAISRDLLDATAHGNTSPDLRLTAVRAFIDNAISDTDLRDWWKAGSVPGGPVLDPELRWRLLERLAVLGACDEREIRAEAERDASATGRQSAARCRAALPDPDAKAATWHALFTEADPARELSNHLFIAAAQSFWQPEQHDLVKGYAARYFADATALAARRGHAIAEAAGRFAFPHTVIDKETLRRGEECLATADAVPALRRQLIDQLDELRRSLRVREATAAVSA